eukprot:UN13908
MMTPACIYTIYQYYKKYNLPKTTAYIYDAGVPDTNGRRRIQYRYQVDGKTYRGQETYRGFFFMQFLLSEGSTGGRAFQYHLNDVLKIPYVPENPEISYLDT